MSVPSVEKIGPAFSESVSGSLSVEARFALRTLPLALSVMVSVWFLVRRQNVDCDFTLRLEMTCSTGVLKDPRDCDRALTSAKEPKELNRGACSSTNASDGHARKRRG